MTAVIFVVMNRGTKGFEDVTGMLHTYDLRNFRGRAGGLLVNLGFLVPDAEPEAGVYGRALRGHFCELLVVPPK